MHAKLPPAAAVATAALILLLYGQQVTSVAVDGGWGPWSTIQAPCNASCGGGWKELFRMCSNPAPSGGGADCQPDPDGTFDRTYVECNVEPCQVAWSDWGPCSESCVPGYREKHALCGENLTICTEHADTKYEACNTYNVTKDRCGDPCDFLPSKEKPKRTNCPHYSVCENRSTEFEAKAECVCILGYQLNDEGDACIRPPPTPPSPRPIPTLPAEVKQVVIIVTSSASTVLLIFVSITLAIFLLLRVFTVDRVIQMNMEVALASAHIILLVPMDIAETDVIACRILSIMNHFFFTACFMFMLLEAIHMYSLVAFVVRRDGMFNRTQNMLIGWGLAAATVIVTMCFSYEEYGGPNHCWLQRDKSVAVGVLMPTSVLTIVTLVFIEAAGNADFKKLNSMDSAQVFSAKVSQRSNLVILALVLASFWVGVYAFYEMSPALYGAFSTLNSVLGFFVFLGHTMGNQVVREKIVGCYNRCCGHGGSQKRYRRKK